MIIKLVGQDQKDRVCELVQALPLDPPMMVEIVEYKAKRSVAQNSLYWMFLSVLAGERGMTKEEVHHECKERFLSKIYIRDRASYSELIDSLRIVYKQDSLLGKQMYDRVIDLTSTKDADTKQFSEYLEDIDKSAIQQGINLPHPEDMWREAMGG